MFIYLFIYLFIHLFNKQKRDPNNTGHATITLNIGLDTSEYQVNAFLIYPRKHMLWVLIRSAPQRRFYLIPKHMFSWRNKTNINTFGLKKKSILSKVMVKMLLPFID